MAGNQHQHMAAGEVKAHGHKNGSHHAHHHANEYAAAVEMGCIEAEIREMESQLLSMHSGGYQPHTGGALGERRSTQKKMASLRKGRTEARQTAREAERKLRDELMRKYKPMLDEELWSGLIPAASPRRLRLRRAMFPAGSLLPADHVEKAKIKGTTRLCSKIELQFPESGSNIAKDKLIKFRQQIFYRRINIELEKQMLNEPRARVSLHSKIRTALPVCVFLKSLWTAGESAA